MVNRAVTAFPYIAAAAFAATVVVYVLGPSIYPQAGEETGESGTAIGLTNHGNDCYINVVLQALRGLELFRQSLQQQCGRPARQGEVQGESHEQSHLALTHALRDLLNRLGTAKSGSRRISPAPFIRDIEKIFGSRISREQQDAHELLQKLLERLSDEYGHQEKPAAKASDSTTSEGEKLRFPFGGCLSSQNECLSCH